MTLVKTPLDSFQKPKHKRDRKLISIQWWELYWISFRYKIPKYVIRDVKIRVGRSRKKVYEELRRLGYLNVPNI